MRQWRQLECMYGKIVDGMYNTAKELYSLKLLWANVLLQAINDLTYLGHNEIQIINKRGANHWFFISKNGDIGSLQWICEFLNLDTDGIRAYAKSLLDSGKRFRSPKIGFAMNGINGTGSNVKMD